MELSCFYSMAPPQNVVSIVAGFFFIYDWSLGDRLSPEDSTFHSLSDTLINCDIFRLVSFLRSLIPLCPSMKTNTHACGQLDALSGTDQISTSLRLTVKMCECVCVWRLKLF